MVIQHIEMTLCYVMLRTKDNETTQRQKRPIDCVQLAAPI